MENIEILERLRNYDFFKDIDYTNEFADRLEKFLIMVIKLKKFEFKNGKLLNYDTIKELLKIKSIKMKRSKIACRKLNLQKKVINNIETLKWRILDDLNVFFKKENIEFDFIKEKDTDINEFKNNEFNNNELLNLIKILRKYSFYKVKTNSLEEEFADRLEKFLILARKTKLFVIKGINRNLSYQMSKKLLKQKNISMKRNFYSGSLSNKMLNEIESLKYQILNDLNVIFKKENIIFELINKENLNEIYKEIDKKFKTLFLRLDNVPENEYKDIINYAFDKGYKLNNFSKFETMEKTLETRATFELDR